MEHRHRPAPRDDTPRVKADAASTEVASRAAAGAEVAGAGVAGAGCAGAGGESAALFVYGTLMPGHLRWSLIEPFADRHHPAAVPGQLYDTGRGYPAARFAPHHRDRAVGADGRPTILGVVVDLAPDRRAETLRLLDQIEGADYRRRLLSTTAGRACWSYEWVGELGHLSELADGRWRGPEA